MKNNACSACLSDYACMEEPDVNTMKYCKKPWYYLFLLEAYLNVVSLLSKHCPGGLLRHSQTVRVLRRLKRIDNEILHLSFGYSLRT